MKRNAIIFAAVIALIICGVYPFIYESIFIEEDVPAYLDPEELMPKTYTGVPGSIPFREAVSGTGSILQLSADVYLEGIYRPGSTFDLSHGTALDFENSPVLQAGMKINNAEEAQRLCIKFLQEQQREYSMNAFVPACVTNIVDKDIWLLTYESTPMVRFGWIFLFVDGEDGSYISAFSVK